MILKTLIFTILFVTTYGEHSAGCNREGLIDLLNGAKHSIQKWRQATHAKDFHFYEVTEVTENAIDQYEDLVKDCSDDEKSNLLAPVLVAAGIVADDPVRTELILSQVEDNEFFGTVLGLFCSLDCSYLFDFTKKLEAVDSKLRFYNVLTDLFEKTDLNHTLIDTTLTFIKDVNTALHEEKSEEVKTSLEKLLLHAIKADLVLQHDNIDKLYEINESITREAILELVDKYTLSPLISDDDITLYPLFEIIKCTNNLDIWVENLEIAFKKLKDNDKAKSVNSLILLKSLDLLEPKVSAESKAKLEHIRTEIPEIVKDNAYKAQICTSIDDEENIENRIFIQQIGNEYQVVKFIPKPDGPKMLLTGKSDDSNFTLITNTYDQNDNFYDSFDVVFTKEQGDLTILSKDKFCNTEDNSLYGCLPVKVFLPPTTFGLDYLGIFKKLGQYYVTMGSCDVVYVTEDK